ncbi:MAG: TonB-dependent receptor, partial [Gemmatimonadetes bacterium]|nr:TonB-dependent receptor [Gemmatimonadota bacterium]
MTRPSLLAIVAFAAAVVPPQLHAQSSTARAGAGIGVIRGRLADSASGAPIATGSVTIRHTTDTAVVAVAHPQADGAFRIDGLAPGSYALNVRVLGFAPLRRAGIAITAAASSVDVGILKLSMVATKLESENVVAERAEIVVAPDRTSYSTKNMTAAAGGTAVDILKNIPLVEVDASNKVSLRGNDGVIIQINGRPSPLKGDQLAAFLAQLPATAVKTVEVATNPSAKDDPEGNAGIINIVLNQEAEMGLSGGVSVGTSTTGMVNLNGNIGQQKGKLTVYFSSGLYRDRRGMTGTISRENLSVPTPAFVETSISGKQRPFSGQGNFRAEYRFSDISSLTLDSYGWGGRYGGDNTSFFSDLDASREVIGMFNQYTSNLQTNKGGEADLTFRRQGKPTDPLLTAEIDAWSWASVGNQDITGDLLQPDASITSASPAERDHTIQHGEGIFSKMDYTRPFSVLTKLETGYKAVGRRTKNDFNAALLDPGSGAFVDQPGRANAFDFEEGIAGVYGLLSQRFGKFQLQGGTRVELAAQRFTVRPLNQDYDHKYSTLYPSSVLSYNFSDMRTAKLSYSRRVERPNPWRLSPIEYRQDARSIFRGNPNLTAEYTDAFEASLQDAHSWGSAGLTSYVRRTAHAVRNIQFVDSTGMSVSTFDNVASTKTIGTDLNLNVHGGPVTLNASGSAYHYSSDASNLSPALSASDIVWSTRLNSTYKVSPKLDGQAFVNYRAPYRTEGGSQLANVNMNFSMRYKPWGDQGGAVSLRVSDPFGLSKYGYRTANGTVVEFAQRYFQQRALFLTVSRNFGQELKLKPKE